MIAISHYLWPADLFGEVLCVCVCVCFSIHIVLITLLNLLCQSTHLTFSLQAIRHEAFTHMEAEKEFVQIDPNDLYPYLLVNVGSGVSIIKVLVYFCFFFIYTLLWFL